MECNLHTYESYKVIYCGKESKKYCICSKCGHKNNFRTSGYDKAIRKEKVKNFLKKMKENLLTFL